MLLGSTPKAFARRRTVMKWGACLPCSSRQIVLSATPDSFARSDCEINFFSRNSLSEGMIIF